MIKSKQKIALADSQKSLVDFQQSVHNQLQPLSRLCDQHLHTATTFPDRQARAYSSNLTVLGVALLYNQGEEEEGNGEWLVYLMT
jgi:hypothetical protein